MGIRQKLVCIHLLLVVVLAGGLGIRQYTNQWDLAVSQSVAYHNDLSQRLLAPISAAISGRNYANIYLPVFVNELRNTASLRYLSVDGISDDGERYRIAYLKEIGKPWRTHYPTTYKTDLDGKIRKLEQHIVDKDSDSVKINFLLNRARDEIKKFEENAAYIAKANLLLNSIDFSSPNEVDIGNGTLAIHYPSENVNGGAIKFLFTVTPLKEIRSNIVHSIAIELLIALALSTLVLYFSSRWITKPVEKLTTFMSSDLHNIDPEEIPAQDCKDEVGKLARRFRTLVTDGLSYIEKIETLSTKDALTGLYNRRFYDDFAEDEIARASRSDTVVSYFYIDVDNFKKYNDTYGHKSGDVVLQRVARLLKDTLARKSDLCFRLGGEEFLIIVNTKTAEDASQLAENVCRAVAREEIEHTGNDEHGHITVSIGAACFRGNYLAATDDVLDCADGALYEAKAQGRNQVVFRTYPMAVAEPKAITAT